MSALTATTDPRTRYWGIAKALVWRELVVRYKRSVLGIGWALAEPVVMVLLYLVVFGIILGADGAVDNYSLFALFGVLSWTFLSSSLDQGAMTLLMHASLLRKIAFPWEILVISVVTSRASTLLFGALFGIVATPFATGDADWSRLPLLFVGLLCLIAIALGGALLLSTLQTVLRDTSFIVSFVMKLGFFLCPVAYPFAMVPEGWRAVYELNPMVGILWLCQAFSNPNLLMPSTAAFVSAGVFSVATLVIGVGVHRRMRPLVADLI